MQIIRCVRFLAAGLAAVLSAFGVGSAPAAEATGWQLTFSYSEAGLVLQRAAPMPRMAKAPRTPGLEGAVLKLDYAVEWLDPTGQPILAAPVIIPLGHRVVMALDETMATNPACIRSDGAFVIRVEGPDADAQVTQVRLVKLAAPQSLQAGGLNIPRAFDALSQTFALPEPAVRLAAAGPLSATRIRNTGPDTNRLVIVFMGDGFTASNLAAGTFSNKVAGFLNVLLGVSPWNLYAQLVNAYRVDIVSNQQGADYENASPSAGGTLKDTYLNTAFWVGGTERCLSPTGDGTSKAYAAADELVGVGVWDEILIFVNSQKYGGCGGSVGTSSLNSSSDEVQIHEFGHSFAGLADEYDYGSSSTNCNSTLARNVDCSTRFPSVKWDLWVTPGAPIPTPDTSTYNNVVGAFEGASYQVKGMFRPMRNCRMRSLSAAFCPVCKETHILKLFERIRMVDAATPAFGPAEVPSYGQRQFSLAPLNVNRFSYQWSLGGLPLPDATNSFLTVGASQLTGTNVELRVDITHVTTNVRAQPIVQSNFWRLRPADLPALGVADARVVEGHTGTTQLRFAVTLTFPHDQPVTLEYATADGTARAGPDYTAQAGALEFAPGETTNHVSVPVNGDTLAEPNEVFFLNLFSVTGAVLNDRQACGTILDDDTAPVVTLTSPAQGAVLLAPVNVSLVAAPADYDGRVTNVQFIANGAVIGDAIFRPFSITWSNVAPGGHVLSAVARDNSGFTATSAPVRVTVLATSTQQWTLVSLTNTWRYDASTTDYGAAWRAPEFDDTLWLGPSVPVFYNETARLPAPTNTFLPLTNDAGARLRSYYFRTRFDWPSNDMTRLVLVCSNLVDDGAVFWLNGVELGRLRMPGGTITRTTLASATPPNNGDATAFETLSFSASSLRPGTNVLAVSVHQRDDASSDVVFGLSLTATPGLAPVLVNTQSLADALVAQGRPFTVSVTATGLAPLVYQWFREGAPLVNATNPAYNVASMEASHAGAYFVRVSNVVGAVDSPAAQVDYAADLTPPGLVYALGSNNPARILVSFSEPIQSASAILTSNYRITPAEGGPALAVTLAAVVNGTNVLLTTAPRVAGTNYMLTVSQVRDLFGNVIAPDRQMPIATEVVLLAGDNQVWRYFQADAAPGAGWMAPGFDDAGVGWLSGTALFDAKRPVRTTITNLIVRTQLSLTNPQTASSQTLAYYFRSPFYLPSWPAGARLRLRPAVDDGAVFYLNGQEVHRLRLPAAPTAITYTNLATSVVDSAFYEGPFDLPTGALLPGTNLFAVEVHQSDRLSSDISFAAQLVAEVPELGLNGPRLTWTSTAGGVVLWWSHPGARLQSAPSVLGPWEDMQPPPAGTYSVGITGPAQFFRLRVPEPW